MGLLFKALLVVVCINLVFVFVQAATLDINPTGSDVFYDCRGDLLSEFEVGGCDNLSAVVLVSVNDTDRLPSGTGNVGEGGLFGWITDVFSSVKRWFSETTGLVYLKQLFAGPNRFISILVPDEGYEAFTWALSAAWYGLTLLLIIAFIKGGDA